MNLPRLSTVGILGKVSSSAFMIFRPIILLPWNDVIPAGSRGNSSGTAGNDLEAGPIRKETIVSGQRKYSPGYPYSRAYDFGDNGTSEHHFRRRWNSPYYFATSMMNCRWVLSLDSSETEVIRALISIFTDTKKCVWEMRCRIHLIPLL